MRESTLGNLVNAIARTVLATGLLAVGLTVSGGCAVSEDQRMVGIYSLDPIKSELPANTSRDIERKFRNLTRNVKLKLHSDHHFVFTGARTGEGSWRIEGDQLYLRPDGSGLDELVALIGTEGEIPIRISGDRGLMVDQLTGLGKLKLRFRKTG